MFTFHPQPRTVVTRDNFQAIARGDSVALAYLAAGLKKQYSQPFEIGVLYHDQCGEFLDILGNGMFRAKDAGNPFPVRGHILWSLARYAFDEMGARLELPCTQDEKKNTIVIAPLPEVDYNIDRQWHILFTQKLAAACVRTGKEVVIVGAGNQYLAPQNKFPDCRMVLNDLHATCKELRQASAVIGGDSFVSHYVGALESDCKLVSLYGEMSKTRTQEPLAEFKGLVTGKLPPIYYSPNVIKSHPYLYKEFGIPWQPIIDEIAEFCK